MTCFIPVPKRDNREFIEDTWVKPIETSGEESVRGRGEHPQMNIGTPTTQTFPTETYRNPRYPAISRKGTIAA